MIQKFRNRLYSAFEEGFSLAEMIVVVLILGILAAISIPVYLGIQNQANVATVKTGLLQAASLIEQEKTDLDGLYPKYLPNEVTQNELWKNFAYSYSNDRLSFCLQGFDNNNTAWFVTSTSQTSDAADEVTNDVCTKPNIGSNSTLPWAPNTPPVINIDSLNMTWNAGSSTPTATMSWTAATCTNRDQTITPSTQYNILLHDVSENVTIPLNGVVGTNISTDKLPGFLPSDTVQATIAVVCVTKPVTVNNQTYTTTGSYSTVPATAVTPALPVPSTSFTSNPTASLTQNTQTQAFTMTSTGKFASITCPLGTAAYQIVATEPNATPAVQAVASSGGANVTQAWTLTNFKPDTKIQYTGNAYCVITRTNTGSNLPTSYPSANVLYDEGAPVGWPQGVTNLATTSAYSGTNTTPNGLTWTATTCAFGGTPYYSYVQSAPTATGTVVPSGAYQPDNYASGDKTMTDSAGAINWVQGRQYTYYINAKCVGTYPASSPVQSQAIASSPSLTFTTDVTPPTPSFASNPTAYFVSQTQMNVRAQLNAVTCPGDNSTTSYTLTAYQPSNGKSVTSPTNQTNPFDFDITALATNTSTTYTGIVTCTVPQADKSVKAYSASVTYTATTPGVAPNITTSSLPYGVLNQSYSQTVTATGTPTPTYGVSSGSLPNGLSLNTNSGVISGTPTNAGTFNFVITASNLAGTANKSYTITVYTPPSITTTSLPYAVQGSGYSQQVSASGSPTITFAITSNSLPSGMSLSSNGVISGNPTSTGTSSFTVTASSPYGSSSQNLSITVYAYPSITTSSLPNGTVGSYYSQTVNANGVPSPNFYVSSGSLPSGLNLNTSNGNIYGTPNSSNYYNFTITAYNTAGSTSQSYSVTIYQNPYVSGTNINNPGDASSYVTSYIYFNSGVTGLTGCGMSGAPNGYSVYQSGNTCVVQGTPQADGSSQYNYGITVTGYNAVGNASYSWGTGAIPNFVEDLHGQTTANWQQGSNLTYAPGNTQAGYSNSSSSSVKADTNAPSSTGTTCNLNGTNYTGLCGHLNYFPQYITSGASYHISACFTATTTSINRVGFTLNSSNSYATASISSTSFGNKWVCLSSDWNINAGDHISFVGANTSTTSIHEWEVSNLVITRN